VRNILLGASRPDPENTKAFDLALEESRAVRLVFRPIADAGAAGLLAAAPHPSRAGQLLSLTEAGRAALERWATSIEAITSLGLDPFRLRTVAWDFLSAGTRQALFARLFEASEAEMAALRVRAKSDAIGRRQTELAIAVVAARLAWLKARRTERA